MSEDHQAKRPMSTRAKVLAGAAIIIGVVGLIASGRMALNRGADSAPTAVTSTAAMELPSRLGGSCIAVAHPAGPIMLPMRLTDFVKAMQAGGGVVHWEDVAGGGVILRIEVVDQLKQTSGKVMFQFDPVTIGAEHCLAATRLIDDQGERSPEVVWAFMQATAASVQPAVLAPVQPEPAEVERSAASDTPDDSKGPTPDREANERVVAAVRGAGVVDGMPYADAKQRLIAAGFKLDPEVSGFSYIHAYPELDCTHSEPVCEAHITSPLGSKAGIVVVYSELEDDDEPQARSVRVRDVEAGN